MHELDHRIPTAHHHDATSRPHTPLPEKGIGLGNVMNTSVMTIALSEPPGR